MYDRSRHAGGRQFSICITRLPIWLPFELRTMAGCTMPSIECLAQFDLTSRYTRLKEWPANEVADCKQEQSNGTGEETCRTKF